MSDHRNYHDIWKKSCYTEDLQQQKVKSIKCVTTTTELVVVWSGCSNHKIYYYSKSFGHSYSCNTLLLPLMLQGYVKLLM